MPSKKQPNQQTRRSFLGLSIASATGLLLQSCTPSRLGSNPSANLPSSFTPVASDHPLTQLQFRNQGVLSSSMHVGPVDTPVLFSEGLYTWHRKGSHPYPYLLPVSPGSPEFDPSVLTPETLAPPPIGIRSAPALGGLGTGTIQLRSDGSLADWQIFNNSPGDGASKIHVPDAFLGIRTVTSGSLPKALTIRTQPPEDLPAMQSIAAAGGFPVTALSLSDPSLLLATQVYAYGALDLHNPVSSALPAVIFSVVMSNPTPYAVTTSLMFAMPNVIEGTFRAENGLILSRSGDIPMAGGISMAFSSGAPSYSMVSPDLKEIWDTFEKEGNFQQRNALGIFEYGAVSTQFVIEPRASRTTTLVLSWRFPNRFIAEQSVGNFYTSTHTSIRSVSQEIDRRLPELWSSMRKWQQLCLENTLPAPIQDALLNSLSLLYKTTFATSDGRWRHWDSFANPSVSSLDQHMFRVFPLLFFAPDIFKNQLRAFATHQSPSGQLLDALGMGERLPLDAPGGPLSTTRTPVFFLLVYLYYCYTNDRDFLQDLWPHIDKSIAWQLSITNPQGLPSEFPELGDWQAMDTETIALTDALLHIGGLQAAIHMARDLNLSDTAKSLQTVVTTGIKALDSLFWNDTHYRSHSAGSEAAHIEKESSTLIGFLLPLLAGFPLVSPERLQQHLDHVHSDELSQYPSRAMQWAALSILANENQKRGLSEASDVLTQQRDTMRDLWGYYEQLTENGQPWANPNHTSHLSIWFVLLALSGQRYEAPSNRLAFSPRVSGNASLPFFTPDAHGLLTIQKDRYIIEVISGRLILNELHIGPLIRHRDIVLESGQSLTLTA